MIPVDRVNVWDADDAYRRFLHCCGANRWAQAMVAARPFGDETALLAAAGRQFAVLTRTDWLEAFAAHPRIGDLDSLRLKFQDTAHLAAAEQASVRGTTEAIIQALARGNVAYERKFGYIFIVCATGKTAAQMLALLEARLTNEPDLELELAAAEQRQITRLRLEKIAL